MYVNTITAGMGTLVHLTTQETAPAYLAQKAQFMSIIGMEMPTSRLAHFWSTWA
jgi:hypothetical protein